MQAGGLQVTPGQPSWLQVRGSHAFPLLGFSYLLDQLTELRETLGFPGGPMAKTVLPVQGAQGSIPGQGTRS